jgi:hypothetical protein
MNYEIGSTVGDYQVVGILGAGGMGKVYKVRNVISDRVEAMKVLLPDLANEPDLGDRFLREIKLQASLKHPNIAALHTALRIDNVLLMLMEFVEGETLEEKLKKGPLATGPAVDYMMQALSALEYAHAHGVIHRDIKPANMILTDAGVIKLMDFGIAKGAADRKLTMTGTTMGSLYYMSPEQIQGSATLDARSDLYSLGVTLYELVTGKRPFDGDSQFSIMSAHLQNTPTPPIALDPKLPRELNDIILLAVTKDPAQRFQTAAAFRNALSSVATAQPAAAPILPKAAPVLPQPAAVAPQAAPARAKDSFHLIEPTAPAKPAGKRGLWMAVGALAVVAVAIAAIQFGPWTHAARTVTPPAPSTEVAPTQIPAPPPQAAPDPAPAPAQAPAPAPVVSQPLAASPKPITPPASPVRQNAQPASRPPERAAAPQVVAAPPPVQQTAPAPAATVAAPPRAPAPQSSPAASRAELQEIREQLAMLGVRAGGIRSSLQSLQRSQAASGMNLRGDMQEAANLMNTYLDGAAAALNAGDAGPAKSFMEKAERQVEKLEKFLNR